MARISWRSNHQVGFGIIHSFIGRTYTTFVHVHQLGWHLSINLSKSHTFLFSLVKTGQIIQNDLLKAKEKPLLWYAAFILLYFIEIEYIPSIHLLGRYPPSLVGINRAAIVVVGFPRKGKGAGYCWIITFLCGIRRWRYVELSTILDR